MVLVNGKCSNLIEITDRGFQYGDGLFETIEVRSGKPLFLNLHLERLTADCLRLQIPPPPADLLRAESLELCAGSERAVLKLIVTRGSGGRGYRPPAEPQPSRVLSLHPYPDYPDANRLKGIRARFCRTRLGLNPALAGIKHLNRLEQVLARSEWDDPGIQEGIVLDMNGHVIEGTMTNLFYVKHNVVFTPDLTLNGVNGVTRRILMALLKRRNVAVHEAVFTSDELLAADEVFVCNSIIGLWPIQMIENTCFPENPFTQLCRIELEALKQEAINDDQ